VTAPERLAVEVVGPHTPFDASLREQLAALDGVESVLVPSEPAPRTTAAHGPVSVDTPIGPLSVGGEALVLAYGPCSVDSEDDLFRTAEAARDAGARLLRGGAFKPRTSPYAFQGLGNPGLPMLRRAAGRIRPRRRQRSHVGSVARPGRRAVRARAARRALDVGDAAPEGRRPLRPSAPVKRGFGATVDEWLLAAEYLLDAGATGVILCERGIGLSSPAPAPRSTLVAWRSHACARACRFSPTPRTLPGARRPARVTFDEETVGAGGDRGRGRGVAPARACPAACEGRRESAGPVRQACERQATKVEAWRGCRTRKSGCRARRE